MFVRAIEPCLTANLSSRGAQWPVGDDMLYDGNMKRRRVENKHIVISG